MTHPISGFFAQKRQSATCAATEAPFARPLGIEDVRDGIGGIDPARLERSIDQIAEGFKFQKRPSAADIFDESFLPPLGGRLIN